MLLLADAVGATVCRRDGGGPSRYGQQASHRENVARTRQVTANIATGDSTNGCRGAFDELARDPRERIDA